MDDASDGFHEATRAYQEASGAAAESLVAPMVALARPRDVMTLLLLATKAAGLARADILEGASRLSQPPSGVDFPVAVAGDNREIWRWFDALPLPPPKSWWLDWPDALPRWLGGASERR